MELKYTLQLSKKALQNPRQAAAFAISSVTNFASFHLPFTTNVFSRSWDLLIILDTCRVDALRQMVPKYDFLGNIGSIWSEGGTSAEWMAATFNNSYQSEINKTAYITANGFAKVLFEDDGKGNERMASLESYDDTHNFVSSDEFGRIEHIWKYEKKSENGIHSQSDGNPPCEYVTDRAITIGREHDFDRVILHYIQPHYPYISNALAENRHLYSYEANPFDYIRNGGSKSPVFSAYIDDLRYVLDSIELLLANFDAERVAITADHGEAFGEYGTYGHNRSSFHPHVRRVPWTITDSKDKNEYQPSFNPETPPTCATLSAEAPSVAERLNALGYR